MAPLMERFMDFHARTDQLTNPDVLEEVISLFREALSFGLTRPVALMTLPEILFSRYERLGEIHDLNEAILLGREALSLSLPEGDHSRALMRLANHHSSRHKQLWEIDDLNDAISLGLEMLSLRPPGHPDRSESLNWITNHLSCRHEQLGAMDDLNEVLVLGREALALCPSGHPDRSASLNNLAVGLCSRGKRLGEVDDLNEAIVLGREALTVCPTGGDRSLALISLAYYLTSRYDLFGGIEDLNEAVVLDREALPLFPPGHPDHTKCLHNLSGHLATRYRQLGEIDDLNEAIIHSRDVLSHTPPGHPHRSKSLSNLAAHLFSRYHHLGGTSDLNETLVLSREALSLYPPGHPDRSIYLSNLAGHLCSQYLQLGKVDDLNEAIDLDREALLACPPEHPESSKIMNSMANHLFIRSKQSGNIDHLNEDIFLGRSILSLLPPGHTDRPMSMRRLAGRLSFRFEQFKNIDDLNEAIVLGREALSLCPPGHPDHSVSLRELAVFHSCRFIHLGKTDDADKQASFDLYAELEDLSHTVSADDLLAARVWVTTAEVFHHPSALSAYETALRLLVEHLVALPPLPQHFALLKSLSSSLAVDAFSACLRNQSPIKAVELLEQGRGVFWTQLTRLHSPLSDVISSGPEGKGLADEFTRLTSLIRTTLHSPGPDQHDRIWGLNLELRKVMSSIRALPGLSRFLLPSLFSYLQCAARDGPVIIVNASEYGCDALVVFVDKDPVHLPLSVTKHDVQELASELSRLVRLSRSMDMTKELALFLRELWNRVVSHIIDFLQTTCPARSRIWWCPTAEFCLLPLHATSPFRKGQKGVSDLYISSYTPTLNALIRARRPSSSDSASHKRQLIAIGQAAGEGVGELLSVDSELANIGQLVDGLATYTRLENDASCISMVADALGKHEWAHFACHGVPNKKQPFESAFALYDGPFTIRRIIQCNLKNPEFAYLSACHTTVGAEESPDEIIHLASAMQFAGFRSVIGTMWAVDDAETNKVTSIFYKLMADGSGGLDYTRAAFALWKTMRSVKIPMDQRILYVHLGA